MFSSLSFSTHFMVVPRFPVLRIPPLHFGHVFHPLYDGPAFSSPAFSASLPVCHPGRVNYISAPPSHCRISTYIALMNASRALMTGVWADDWQQPDERGSWLGDSVSVKLHAAHATRHGHLESYLLLHQCLRQPVASCSVSFWFPWAQLHEYRHNYRSFISGV